MMAAPVISQRFCYSQFNSTAAGVIECRALRIAHTVIMTANDDYLLRMEQLYPFPARALIQELTRFKDTEMIWCQEEPKNMGAWSFVEPNLSWVLEHIEAKHKRPRYVGRPSSAATATGLMSKHVHEMMAFLDEALG